MRVCGAAVEGEQDADEAERSRERLRTLCSFGFVLERGLQSAPATGSA
jgi:hypothetical protein